MILVNFLLDGHDNWLGIKEKIEEGLELDEGFDSKDKGFGSRFCSIEGVEPDEVLGLEVGEMNGCGDGFDRTGCELSYRRWN